MAIEYIIYHGTTCNFIQAVSVRGITMAINQCWILKTIPSISNCSSRISTANFVKSGQRQNNNNDESEL